MGASIESRTIRRFLDGWQLGLLAVALPLLAVWLALPRPVAPKRFPLPEVDRRMQARGLAADVERARQEIGARLPYSIRRVGELVRRFGAANANEASGLRLEARSEFNRALAEVGPKPLLVLRAIQTQLFLASVRRLQERGHGDRELVELAGNFEDKCRRSSWLDDQGLVFSEAELFTLYRIRWTELTGSLERPEFRPSLQEFRLYYRALLLHPEGTSEAERDAYRLLYVRALGRKDPEYPADLASGVLLARMGQYAAAASALTAHLTAHPDGPHALSARNYLLFALAEDRSSE